MTSNTDADSNDVNVSKLRELALRGKNYRETFETEYLGDTLALNLKPLTDREFLPIAAFLEERLDMDAEDAQEKLEEKKTDDGIDASNFDEEFVTLMQEAAAKGICTDSGDAEGMDDDEVKETVEMLIMGKSLEIAERVLDISSNAEKAEKFRRDGGSE